MYQEMPSVYSNREVAMAYCNLLNKNILPHETKWTIETDNNGYKIVWERNSAR